MEDGFIMRMAGPGEEREVYDCMLSVFYSLEDKSLFVCEDMEYVRRNIEECGFVVIAQTGSGDTAGVFVIEYPECGEYNLGRDAGFLEDDLCKVVHMDTAAVLPQYRGHGLMSRMLVFAENNIDKGRYRYFMATAALHNKPSIASFTENGYKVVCTKKKYGGFDRAILMKDVYVTV